MSFTTFVKPHWNINITNTVMKQRKKPTNKTTDIYSASLVRNISYICKHKLYHFTNYILLYNYLLLGYWIWCDTNNDRDNSRGRYWYSMLDIYVISSISLLNNCFIICIFFLANCGNNSQLQIAIIITKTRLYNFDPLKPQFYIVKLGFTGVYIIFLISAQNIDCGYSLEPP